MAPSLSKQAFHPCRKAGLNCPTAKLPNLKNGLRQEHQTIKTMKTSLFLLSLMILSLTSCYYDKEEELVNCTADATTVKYKTTISSILSSYGCTGCHSGASPSGGHDFSTYEGLKAVTDNGKLW